MSILLGTLCFLLIAIVGVLTSQLWAKSQNDLVRVLVMVGVFCCWMSWILIYMAQMNPLLLPTRSITQE
ncbi:V-type H+-transporting ATPase subunit H [Angomonas deanei]|uniref:ATP synthase subunit H, putative n=1 Tax=Angomonas deanei TaxID=59799 RepID=S9X4C1_9TRYP|nr:V-type H+-transporting ATPase subunit H [Angomonas deanei]EPY43335.1 V-type H+-transporting ATPase subunit H [Angomonas deanei]CAD2219002.1 ATP synthase subunit H, putative [Angomonas deanei]|eukprot:EPY43290.1 V-type H+-transporting ATPase subunit H [Angomonas deanei]